MSENKQFLLFILCLVILVVGCSKDDNESYSGRLNNADPTKLEGIWSIFQVELDGETVDIPENNPECGRDFFVYDLNNSYTEYLINDNFECTPDINTLNWKLDDGVLTLSNSQGQSEQLMVIELTNEKFVFEANVDYEGDGTADTFTFTARPYNPPADRDIYSSSFNRDLVVPHYDKIRFSWRAYAGFNNFDRYEIYRSSKERKKSEAILIKTITEQETDFFIDENPEAVENLYYYFRLFTDNGMLSESELVNVETDDFQPEQLELTPVVNGNQIDLTWSQYQGYYFSHYEIVVRNNSIGVSSGFDQEYIIQEIDDINVTEYSDLDPPYVVNPVYLVRVVDIFGNRNGSALAGAGQQEVMYKRPEVVEIEFIRKLAIDPNQKSIYFFGDVITNQQNILKFNYTTNSIEAISNISPNTSSEHFMKVVESDYGKELILSVGSDFRIYNAENLEYRYSMRTEGNVRISDFEYVNGLWVVTDDDGIYTFSRTDDNLSLVSMAEYDIETQGSGIYHLLKLEDNKVLVGHRHGSDSFTFNIGPDGEIINKTSVNQITWSAFMDKSAFNANTNIVVDLEGKTVYSAESFTQIDLFDQPFIATGLSKDGTTVLGTDNNPEWFWFENSGYERKVILNNLNTGIVSEKQTKGYPLFVFENHLEEIVSISSGFERLSLDRASSKPDLFIEILQ